MHYIYIKQFFFGDVKGSRVAENVLMHAGNAVCQHARQRNTFVGVCVKIPTTIALSSYYTFFLL